MEEAVWSGSAADVCCSAVLRSGVSIKPVADPQVGAHGSDVVLCGIRRGREGLERSLATRR
ncbi:hypothetical protein JMUB6875_58780 [Nocardia sp. JMUB6875]